ncbi:DEAD-domain-containing protein [Basidiobolus meristosporus CBS 931.73]|uniref:RNA helicase n=1 Tax=Basidiobolus meristosporus CBS 931.73 TaxID=1314790 RepID=A0A1Y1XS45_9FUNG|nr:DEAD-domain-containing protein [Basidiobolus meristosporus CBS 931.73]|eukprot:ORX88505.1 DEAD-domain-containing protein [Basidiobolus meristosporus CBS 931.73]
MVKKEKPVKPKAKQPYYKVKKAEDTSDYEEVSQDDDSDVETPNIASALVPTGGALLDDGFEDLDEEESFIAKQNQAANKKRKKSGGFQSMGLSYPIYKAILHKGFKVPTPIQRKTVPIIMEGKDVVGMARTGSGKTAAFLIPLLEKLKSHSAKVGARAIVLSPSRELAMQTQKVAKELGKYTDLRSCIIVGGDNMEDQFQMLAANPDIIIATPGRLLHLIVEMEYDLKSVEYIVFDEADRLFEMGFSVQLHEILSRLPASRQTLLFSATLPKLLVDFAKAGLQSPTLVRLDADTKISKDLEMAFFSIKHEEKEASLLLLLRDVIKTQKITSALKYTDKKFKIEDLHQTIIFVSTKHHVEYLNAILTKAGYAVSYIYGSLDQTARKIQINDFRLGKTSILVVTDVAARGIDIPVLENVINYDFVDSSKVFIHRVGRVARAGRRGWAYSLVTNEELPYLLDLQLFLDRQLLIGQKESTSVDYTQSLVIGSLPRNLLEISLEWIQNVLHDDLNISALLQVSKNGYKLYCKSRPSAAPESYKRAKDVISTPGFSDIHPILREAAGDEEQERLNMINKISGFRPHETIFEIGNRGTKKASEAAIIMKKRRTIVDNVIEAKKADVAKSRMNQELAVPAKKKVDEVNEDELVQIFDTPKKSKKSFRDEEYYMSYTQTDANTEKGYSMTQPGSFAEQAQSAVLDLQGDERDTMQAKKNQLRWDSKKKNFVRGSGIGADNKKLITTENGTKLPASYKSGSFLDWQKKNRVHMPRIGEQEVSGGKFANKRFKHNKITTPKKLDPLSVNYEKKLQKRKKDPEESTQQGHKRRVGTNVKGELKSVDQIRKQRELKEKRRQKTGRHNKGGGKAKKGKGRK